jgi:HK97 family phage portal protein
MWQGGRIVYHVTAYDGKFSGTYERERLLHLRGFSLDASVGFERRGSARETRGLGSAAEGSQATSFKNGNRMPGYWSTDQVLRDEEADRIAGQLANFGTGGNAHKSPLLDAGMKYESVAQNFRDAEMVATRKHQIVEVCAAFNVLPSVLGIDDKTQAFASVEAMFRAHLQHTLRPWLVAWEQAIDRDVLDGIGPLSARHDTSDMEKASTKERAESYRNLMETFVLMPNEARRLEGRDEIPGLDEEWRKIRRGMAGLDKTAPAAKEGESDDADPAADPA